MGFPFTPTILCVYVVGVMGAQNAAVVWWQLEKPRNKVGHHCVRRNCVTVISQEI